MHSPFLKSRFFNPFFLILPVVLIIFFKPAPSQSAERTFYSVQLASHQRLSNAEDHVQQLNSRGYDAFYKKVDIPDMGQWHRIFIGRFKDKNEATAVAEKLKEKGFSKDITIKALPEIVTIGVIDTRRILQESNRSRLRYAAYAELLNDKRAVLESERQKVLAMEKSLKNGETSGDLSEAKRDLARLKEDLEEELKEKAAVFKKEILYGLKKVVKNYSEKEAYHMLLEKSYLIVIDKWIEVTDEIISLYDNEEE